MKSTFSIINGTRGTVPRVPFSNIKDRILGKRYELSLNFIGDTKMRSLNKQYRSKDATTDILSFPLDKTLGEIFISLKEADRRAKKFSMTSQQYLTYLYIHGCLHLDGHDHGPAMDALETKWCKAFSIPSPHLG